MKALPKVATSVTRLSGRHLSGNKTGNSTATDWQPTWLAIDGLALLVVFHPPVDLFPDRAWEAADFALCGGVHLFSML
jgi:hypothetical protein